MEILIDAKIYNIATCECDGGDECGSGNCPLIVDGTCYDD